MLEALLISNILSWIVITVLVVTVLALARQVGVLHERVTPVGALSFSKGVEVGEQVPAFNLPSLTGGMVALGNGQVSQESVLLFFLSATCPVCKSLLPMLKSLQTAEQGRMKLVFASDGDEPEHQALIQQEALADYPYVLSRELGMTFQISKLPYGVLIDEQGDLVAHGLINNREHLESLLEAKSLGVSSIQEYHNTVQTVDPAEARH